MSKKAQAPPSPRDKLPKALVEALSERPVGIDSGELLAALTRAWGGPDQIATEIRQEFMDAPAGGMTRQRILEMLTRLVVNTTDKEHYRAKAPSDMTNEELEIYAADYHRRMMEAERRRQLDQGGGGDAVQGEAAPQE